MAINLSDNILAKTTAPADAKYGPYAAGTTAGATAAAIAALVQTYRYEGLTVGIKSGTNPLVEYWFVGGTADNNLTFKASVDTNYYPTALSWTNGTTAGPTGTLTIAGGGSDVVFPSIPSASATISGIVNTTSQILVGNKTFSDLTTFSAGLTATGATFTGNIQATGFKTPGGSSTGFLKADGSVDSSFYATLSVVGSTYLALSGGTMTGGLTGTSASFTNFYGTFNGTASSASQLDHNIVIGITGPDIVTTGATVTTAFSGNTPILISTTLSNTGVTAGSNFNTFSVDAKGRITAASTQSYASTDKLNDITSRGATSSSAITINNHTDSSSSSTGALIVQGGVGITGQLFVDGNTTIGGTATIQGNLIVNGNSTVISSTQIAIQDAILVLGGTAGATAGDTLDKGVKYSYWSGSSKNGYFGYDQSTSYFSYYSDATETSGIISGTLGDMAATNFRGNLIGTGATLSGGLTASTGSFSSNLTLNNGVLVLNNQNNGNNKGTFYYDTELSGGNLAIVFGSVAPGATAYVMYSSDLVGFYAPLGGATFSGRIATTNHTDSTSTITGALQVQGGIGLTGSISVGNQINIATSGTNVTSFSSNSTTLATVSATPIDTFAIATYRSGKYLVQVTQGTNYQVSEITIIHNGTTTMITEYGVLETNGPLTTFTSDVTGGNARLIATMGSATSATIKVSRNLVVI